MSREELKKNPIEPVTEKPAGLENSNEKLEAKATILNEGKEKRAPLQNEVVPEKLEKISVKPSEIALVGDSIGTGIERAFNNLDKDRKTKIGGNGMLAVGGVKTFARDVPASKKTKNEIMLDADSITFQIDKVDSSKFPYLIIQGGTNDIGHSSQNPDPRKVAIKLINLYKQALAKQPPFKKVMLITIPPHKDMPAYTDKRGERHAAFDWETRVRACNDELRKLATDEGINLFDLYSECMKKVETKEYSIPGDGVHPGRKGYETIANILIAGIASGKYDPSKTSFIAEQLTAQTIQIEKENPARAMHMKYLETAEKLNEADVKADEEFIRKASIKDLRKKSRLLNAKPATEEKPIEQIMNLKDETARRLRAYTDTRDNKWYTINYEKFGSDSTGSSHEMNIGLGDILLDNDIEEILVMKTNGETIRGHKQVVNNRVGFADENGQYIATYTGDKFRILSGKEVDIKNEKEVASYINKIKDHDTTRETVEIYTNTFTNRERNQIGAENAKKILELKKEVRANTQNITDEELYLKISALAKTKAKEATDQNEKTQWEIIEKDCMDTARVIGEFPGFDLNLYKRKIHAAESGKSEYRARNDRLGRKLGVRSSKWAFGKYQFLAPTAAAHGARFNPENEEEIQGFLNDPVKQEEVMNSFTLANLKIYSRLPEQRKREFAEAGIDVYKILGAMHLGGAGILRRSLSSIRNAQDWIATNTKSKKTLESSYWKNMDSVRPISETEENTTAKGDMITVPEFDKYHKKIVSTLSKKQRDWVIGSSSGVTISSKTRNTPDMGAFGIKGAGPKEVFETIENIVANLNSNDLPKKVTLVGMGVNGLSENGNTEKTVNYNMEYYMKIAKLFESKGVTVKISPLQIAPSKKNQIIAFNNALRNNPEYSKYCIETGVDKFYADHPTGKGYEHMINQIRSSKLDSESGIMA